MNIMLLKKEKSNRKEIHLSEEKMEKLLNDEYGRDILKKLDENIQPEMELDGK